MKCHICNSRIDEGILKKIIGTYIKDSSGKKRAVCNECQSKFSGEELKEKIN